MIIVLDRSKPHMNLGTIGHVDHGKTTLSAAISFAFTADPSQAKDYSKIDNAPEERKRGITISASHIEYETANRHYAHVDCPGHADYIKNMVVGAAQMDAAIIVIDAAKGVMEQTKEHISLASQLGVARMILYINKVDTIPDPELLDFSIEHIMMELGELTKKLKINLEDILVVSGSALLALAEMNGIPPSQIPDALKNTATVDRNALRQFIDKDVYQFSENESTDAINSNIESVLNTFNFPSEIGLKSIVRLMMTIDRQIPIPKRDIEKPFLLPIENSFNIKGIGPVATGRVERGVIRPNEEVEILSFGGKITKGIVTKLEMFKKEVKEGICGDDLAVRIRGVDFENIARGGVIALPGSIKLYEAFVCEMYVLSGEEGGRKKPFHSGYRPQFFLRTADVTGEIYLPENLSTAAPGDTLKQLTVILHTPVAIEQGMTFAVREGGHTVARGTITEVLKDVPNLKTKTNDKTKTAA